MNVEFKPSEEVWRRRGRPQKQIPAQVQNLANQTYRTGQACVVTVSPEDEHEADELVRLLRLYAQRQGCKMRVRRDGERLLFQMIDKTLRQVAA